MNLQTVAPDYQKLEAARLAMATEAGAISAAAQRLDVEMALAMEVIEAHPLSKRKGLMASANLKDIAGL